MLSSQDRQNGGQSSIKDSIIIGVVGVTGSGKSDFIKRLTQCESIVVGADTESETAEIKTYELQHNGRRYTLVDTPGFDDSRKEFDDEAIFKLLADWLVDTYRSHQRLNGLIYLLPINNTRLRGSETRNQRMIKKVCGEDNFKNVMLGLTFCDQEQEWVVQARKRELMENQRWWGKMIERGAVVQEIPYPQSVANNPYMKAKLQDNDRKACLTILERFAQKEKMVLQLQSEVVDRGIDIGSTAAALTVLEELAIFRAEAANRLAETKKAFQYRKVEAAANKKSRVTELGREFQKGVGSYQQQQAALLLERQKQEDNIRQERVRLEEYRKTHEERKRIKERELEEALRQVKLEDERLQTREHELKQQGLKLRAFHSNLTSSMDALNRWGSNGGVTHGNIVGHDMLGNFCDRCLLSPMPRKGHVYTCETCYRNGNNPLRDLQGGEKTLMICASCKARGHGCLDDSHQMKAEPIPVMKSLLKCRKTGNDTDISCKKCKKSLQESLYLHCCECEGDTYDVCMSCWGKGGSCKSLSHTLHVLSWCPPHIKG